MWYNRKIGIDIRTYFKQVCDTIVKFDKNTFWEGIYDETFANMVTC